MLSNNASGPRIKAQQIRQPKPHQEISTAYIKIYTIYIFQYIKIALAAYFLAKGRVSLPQTLVPTPLKALDAEPLVGGASFLSSKCKIYQDIAIACSCKFGCGLSHLKMLVSTYRVFNMLDSGGSTERGCLPLKPRCQ